jgi:hypothetical protein
MLDHRLNVLFGGRALHDNDHGKNSGALFPVDGRARVKKKAPGAVWRPGLGWLSACDGDYALPPSPRRRAGKVKSEVAPETVHRKIIVGCRSDGRKGKSEK